MLRFHESRHLSGFLYALAFTLIFFTAFYVHVANAAETAQPQPLPPANHAMENAVPSLHVHLEIKPDGSIIVNELYKNFKGTLVRHFNGILSSSAPFVGEHPITLLAALRDGKPVTKVILDPDNSPHIRLGSASSSPQERHTYFLSYKTKGHVLFEKKQDKLIWDVVGRFNAKGALPPMQVSCSVKLPENGKFIEKTAWQGHETTKHSPMFIGLNTKGNPLFKGKKLLQPGEDFVVTISWEKGVVLSDGSDTRLKIFAWTMWGLVCLAFGICWLIWNRFGKDPKLTAIPQYYPPVLLDSTLLSPAAADYIRSSADLTSKGFSGLLLNLAAQHAMYIKRDGVSSKPYCLIQAQVYPPGNAKAPDSSHPRTLWNWLLSIGKGFDPAEKQALSTLFWHAERDKTQPLLEKFAADIHQDGLSRTHSTEQRPEYTVIGKAVLPMKKGYAWALALARDAAYSKLEESFRHLWKLQFTLVGIMHFLVYATVCLVLIIFWTLYGSGFAYTMTVFTLSAALAFLLFWCVKRIHRIWMLWREMGVHNLFVLCMHCAVMLTFCFYILLLGNDQSFAGFPGWKLMQEWSCALFLLLATLTTYIALLTRSFAATFLYPFKLLGLLCLLSIPVGCLFYIRVIPPSAAIPMLTALIVPTLFAPYMKKPTEEGAKVLAELEGFAMYIRAAESNRLNMLNPPERTPEEFHRVLPYAVALGLEKAWGRQFTDIVSSLHFTEGRMVFIAEYERRIHGA